MGESQSKVPGESEASHLAARRVFISYGHDEHASLAVRLKEDLEARGHDVWFDLDRLKSGVHWETYIEEGLEWVASSPSVGRIILLMTPHSVRRPDGYCLNEIARALSRRLTPIPIMVVWCEPPLSICRIQRLDMRDCVPVEERQELYEVKFKRLLEALEHDRLDFEGTQARLDTLLDPLPFEADILEHLPRFTGRQWVFERIDGWLAQPNASRVFWIMGAPGVGKTAIAAWLCSYRREVAAFHFCVSGHTDKSDPRKVVCSIAHQLASQLPDYQTRLNALNLEHIVVQSNAQTLFDTLIVQPLVGNFPRPDRTILIVIDAIDEATSRGENELATLIATAFRRTPDWLRLIITSRPEPEVLNSLQALKPYMLDASTDENEADLRAYMAVELKPFAENGVLPQSTIDDILVRSEGLFLYVEYIRRELEEDRLSLDRIEEFPQGLGSVYLRYFKRQFPDIHAFEDSIRSGLEVISAARESPEIEVLASIFSWTEYARAEFLRSIGSLFPNRDDRIQPFHRTVIEWLTNPTTAGDYFVSTREGHRRLADHGWQQYQMGVAGRDRQQPVTLYTLRHLPSHLGELARLDELRTLLFDFDWLQAKLEATDVAAVLADFELECDDHDIRLIESAIRISAHVLSGDKTQLAGQLTGRLLWCDSSRIRHLLGVAAKWRGAPWMRPLSPSLTSPGGHLMRTLGAYDDGIGALAITPDGRRAVSRSSHGGTIKVWNLESGTEPEVLGKHGDSVLALAITGDGRRAVSGARDGTLQVWDLDRAALVRIQRGDGVGIMALAITPDGLRAVSSSRPGGIIYLWDLATGTVPVGLGKHGHRVLALAITADGRRAVSGSSDGTLQVWDLDRGGPVRILGESHDTVTPRGSTEIQGVAATADGRHAVTCSRDGTVKLWDLENEVEARVVGNHNDQLMAIAVTRDGRRAVTGASDGTLQVWDLWNGTPPRALGSHRNVVKAVVVTPDGQRAVSGSVYGTIQVWDLDAPTAPRTHGSYGDGIQGLAITTDAQRVVSASWNGRLQVWNWASAAPLRILDDRSRGFDALAITADDRRAVAGADGMFKTWDLESGLLRWTLDTRPDFAIAVTADGRRAVSGSRDGTVRVWDLEGGRLLRTLDGHIDRLVRLAISANGQRAVSCSLGNTLHVWDLEYAAEPWILGEESGLLAGLHVSADGRRAVSGASGTLKAWDLENRSLVRTFKVETSHGRSVAITPDGRRVVAGSAYGTVGVWDLESSNEPCLIAGKSGAIRALAIAPDGRRAVSASTKGTLDVWDLESGSMVCAFTMDWPASACALTRDGETFVGGDENGWVHVLRLVRG